jgi:uncharacterized membrane protein (UPF0182 family)
LSFSSSTIIEDVKAVCDAGQASMAYFYFDFRDTKKQRWRDLVPSLLTQLSTQLPKTVTKQQCDLPCMN